MTRLQIDCTKWNLSVKIKTGDFMILFGLAFFWNKKPKYNLNPDIRRNLDVLLNGLSGTATTLGRFSMDSTHLSDPYPIGYIIGNINWVLSYSSNVSEDILKNSKKYIFDEFLGVELGETAYRRSLNCEETKNSDYLKGLQDGYTEYKDFDSGKSNGLPIGWLVYIQNHETIFNQFYK